MTPSFERSYAQQQDEEDVLARFRDAFHSASSSNGSSKVYLCGHSLGLQPKSAAQLLQEELTKWSQLGVDGHFQGLRPWVSYHEQLAPGLAHLAGAMRSEVVAMNSLTVNLHLMLMSFYRPDGERNKILIERRAFSSDRYAVCSHLRRFGLDPEAALIEIEPHGDGDTFLAEEICATIEEHGSQIATILLPGVQYLTGQCFDMERIAECARTHGCTIGYDLAHAIGNVPLRLHDWDVDFAVWCSYKYLNAGPGAIGGCFVHERHASSLHLPRLAGWWGHDKNNRFAMPEEFAPLPGAEGWQISNPSIFAAAPLLASLEVFEQAGFDALRAKSIRLTGYLELLLRAQLAGLISVVTPDQIEARGCQLSLRLELSAEEARAVYRQLAEGGFVCDWREPDVLRVAPTPLYNGFVDVWEFAHALRQRMQAA